MFSLKKNLKQYFAKILKKNLHSVYQNAFKVNTTLQGGAVFSEAVATVL